MVASMRWNGASDWDGGDCANADRGTSASSVVARAIWSIRGSGIFASPACYPSPTPSRLKFKARNLWQIGARGNGVRVTDGIVAFETSESKHRERTSPPRIVALAVTPPPPRQQ